MTVPIYLMLDTWNAIGTTFNGIYMNISNGAGGAPVGAAASRAFRLDSNGTKIFDIDINGGVTIPSSNTSFMQDSAAVRFRIDAGTTPFITIDGAGTGYFGWANNNVQAADVRLFRDAANTLALRNGVNEQLLRVYETFTDASNYERINIGWSSAVAFVGTFAAGTGSQRELRINSALTTFQIGGATKWQIDASGNFIAGTDNSWDIGASGATRPRNVYVANAVQAIQFAFSNAAGALVWNTRSEIKSPADGNLTMLNQAETSFGLLQFGGTTSSFPALKRSTTGIEFRLADDSIGTWSRDGVMTIASLPTPASAGAGAHLFVTDALSPAFGVTIAAGGTANTPVYSNGANWIAG